MLCFKCQLPITIEDQIVYDAVRFTGGKEFGSKEFDSLVDGKYAEIYICDNCLNIHRELIKLRNLWDN